MSRSLLRVVLRGTPTQWHRRVSSGSSSCPVIEKKTDHNRLNLLPADNFWTTARDGAVKLQLEETGPASEPPITILDMFQRAVQRYGTHPALAAKKEGQWKKINYGEYYQQCRAAAKSFLKLGLERFHGVSILGCNSPEWFIAELGAIMAGGLPAGVYTTSSAEAAMHVAMNSGANIFVVENHMQLEKVLQIQDQLPHLKAIVQYSEELREKRPNLYTWEEFMQLGSAVPDSELDDIIASMKANQCCLIIYTSGTTGPPKGVMLSHDNVTYMAKTFGTYTGMQENEVIVSYLPMSHVAAKLYDVWMPIYLGGTVYFAKPDALKGSLVETLREVRPTAFVGVPRSYEKLQALLEDMSLKSSAMKRTVINCAKSLVLKANLNRLEGKKSVPWWCSLADYLVLNKMQASLGLDRCLWRHAGAAPITRDTLEYFMGLNIPIMEIFGMSESAGPHLMCKESDYHFTSVGKTLPGCRTKIHLPDEDGNGEICYWGRNVFMGYLGMEKNTMEALDEEGWLHSGDIGKLDQEGHLYLTGRLKELVITAGGENIPPVPIENALKEEVPFISNAVLIGDRRKFLSMLITLKCTIDPETLEPRDDLTLEVIQFIQQLGSKATRVSEVLRTKDAAIYKAIQEGLDRVNKKAVSKAQKVQKWTILEKDFSIDGGELGPTMKLRRPIVLSKYEAIIDGLYKP